MFTREWIVCIFDTVDTAHTAVQSALKAVSSVKDISYLRLRTDNGTQYSSRELKKSMQTLGIRHEFIWRNTPEQNRHVESFHGTLKREYDWPHEFARFQDAEVVLAKAFVDYKDRIHSALGILLPTNSFLNWRGGINEGWNYTEKYAKSGIKKRCPDQ